MRCSSLILEGEEFLKMASVFLVGASAILDIPVLGRFTLPWVPARRPPEALVLRDAILSGDDDTDLTPLVNACCQARVPFRAELLGDGDLWRATPVVGEKPRWQRNRELLPIANRAGQAYSLDGRDSGTVLNYGEVLGRSFYFKAEGSFARAAVSRGATRCPVDFTVLVTRGGVVVGGVPLLTSAISGDGYLRCLYLDEDIRIFESPKDSPDKWEEAGLIVVQVRDGLFADPLDGEL